MPGVYRHVGVIIDSNRILTDVGLPESLSLPRQICVAICGSASSKEFVVAINGCSIESEWLEDPLS